MNLPMLNSAGSVENLVLRFEARH